MARIEASVVINRPLKEVADYMYDVKNWPEWQAGLLEAELIKKTPEVVGSTYRGVAHFLGQRMEWTAETTAFEPYKSETMRTVMGPQTSTATTTLEQVEGGTKVTTVAEAEPVVVRIYGREVQRSLDQLKEILEAKG